MKKEVAVCQENKPLRMSMFMTTVGLGVTWKLLHALKQIQILQVLRDKEFNVSMSFGLRGMIAGGLGGREGGSCHRECSSTLIKPVSQGSLQH